MAVSVGAIIRAIHEDTPDRSDEDAGRIPTLGGEGSDLGRKVVHPMWDGIFADMMTRLDTITVQDLCMQAAQAGIESEATRRLDYSI